MYNLDKEKKKKKKHWIQESIFKSFKYGQGGNVNISQVKCESHLW